MWFRWVALVDAPDEPLHVLHVLEVVEQRLQLLEAVEAVAALRTSDGGHVGFGPTHIAAIRWLFTEAAPRPRGSRRRSRRPLHAAVPCASAAPSTEVARQHSLYFWPSCLTLSSPQPAHSNSSRLAM
jgi:hypothetical protein